MNAYFAEFLGTALLLLLGIGVNANVVLSGTKGHGSGWLVITAGWGFSVFTAVACVGEYSGAHLNPAVTLGLAAAGKFAWPDVTPYVAAQLAGAFVGATLAWLGYYHHFVATEDPAAKLGTFATGPAIRAPLSNVVTEILGTFVLVFAVLHFAPGTLSLDGSDVPIGLGSIGALPVGLVVFVIGMGLGGPTGYAINPARDFGPRLVHAVLPIPGKGRSDWGYAWVPIAGPLLGGLLAAGIHLAAGS